MLDWMSLQTGQKININRKYCQFYFVDRLSCITPCGEWGIMALLLNRKPLIACYLWYVSVGYVVGMILCTSPFCPWIDFNLSPRIPENFNCRFKHWIQTWQIELSIALTTYQSFHHEWQHWHASSFIWSYAKVPYRHYRRIRLEKPERSIWKQPARPHIDRINLMWLIFYGKNR